MHSHGFALILKNENGDIADMRFISKRQKIDLYHWFCKQCFYDWPPDSETPPERCANVRGYINEHGQQIPPCKSRKWDRWPVDFDPSNCKSKAALTVYYQEKLEEELEALEANSKTSV